MTHIDVLICNTFIGTSGFLIILVTIDRWEAAPASLVSLTAVPRWRCICAPASAPPSRPALYCGLALLVSLAWQLPRLAVKTITTQCVPVNQRSVASMHGIMGTPIPNNFLFFRPRLDL